MQRKRVLITAGPTHEKIDPVRYIGNYSSGKMGFALALACAQMGLEVKLIAGPVSLTIDHPLIERINVVSAREMYAACEKEFESCDAAIWCAAVADFRPDHAFEQKVKRKGDDLVIRLVENPDIAATLGARATSHQTLVGFALETHDEQEHALGKMERKHLDMIVLNSLNDAGAGFQVDTNKITLLMRSGEVKPLPLKTKTELAVDIVDALLALMHEKNMR